MLNEFQNRDGWWNKYIKNTGPVEPHWQCIKCDYNDEDIGTIRKHVFTKHKHLAH